MIDLIAMELPATLRFLQPGWIIFHLTVIPVVFVLGMALGRRSMTQKSGSLGASPGTGY